MFYSCQDSSRRPWIYQVSERAWSLYAGRILNVITERVKFRADSAQIDVENPYCGHTERRYCFCYLDVIRVYYEIGEPCYDQIGD